MADITVHPHGERWSVLEAGANSPIKEFGTREAAELAARGLAAGGTVEVLEEDPSGLSQDPDAGEPVERGGPDINAVDAAESTRSLQTGL
jgi:hypothetical protein